MVFFIILVLFYIFIKVLPSNTAKPLKLLDKCPPHAWIYKKIDEDQEFMVCSICKRLPGEEDLYGE